MTATLKSALALAHEARRRGSETILPAPAAIPTPEIPHEPLLIEGALSPSGELTVRMPDGSLWRFNLVCRAVPAKRVLLVCIIDPADCSKVAVFEPSAEGIHPFAGIAIRFGVERSGA